MVLGIFKNFGDLLDLLFGPTTPPQPENNTPEPPTTPAPHPGTWYTGLTMDDRVVTGPAREHGMAIGGTAARLYLLYGLEKYENLDLGEARLLLRHSHDLDLAARNEKGGKREDPLDAYMRQLGYKPRRAGNRTVWKKGLRIVDYFGYEQPIGSSGLSPRDIEEIYREKGRDGFVSLEVYGKEVTLMPLEALLATKLRVKDYHGRPNPRKKDYSDVANLITMYEDQIDAEIFEKLMEKGYGSRDPIGALEDLKEKVLEEDLPRLLYSKDRVYRAIERLENRIKNPCETPVSREDLCRVAACKVCITRESPLIRVRMSYLENDGYAPGFYSVRQRILSYN